MRTTLNIDDQILKKASKLTGIPEKTKLVRLGLEALIEKESAKRLASLGGSEKELKQIPPLFSPPSGASPSTRGVTKGREIMGEGYLEREIENRKKWQHPAFFNDI